MNQQKIDSLSERILNETNSALSCLALYIGHKLDLFNSLWKMGPITVSELAAKTNYSKRYLQEWLECMSVNGYIEYEPSTNKFCLSKEHAIVFCDRNNSAYTIPFVYWIPSLSLALNKLLEVFKSGKGIPYSYYGKELLFAQGEGNRPMFVNDIAKWISSIPNINNKLKTDGGNVLEVGCGDGWASISLAKNYPLIKIDAIDADPNSMSNASFNIEKEGLKKRISLYVTPIEKAPIKEKYDLIMTFESIHDMAYPVEALRKMKEMISKDGAVLVADVKMNDKLQDKNSFAGRLYYNFSVLLCLPQSLEYPDSKATGAAMTPSTFLKYAQDAGFSKIDKLPIEHFIWDFYMLSI
jgi:2-polyprenyl-3-methyl-5-hydroxy-6-metoxy-1,4-benzoquinol methylase